MRSKLYAPLAQSVERGPFKPVVVGSSPTGGDLVFYRSPTICHKNPYTKITNPPYN